MLTILLKRADGTECIFEADSLERNKPPAVCSPQTIGNQYFTIFASPDDQVPATIALEDAGDALFVMNRHGATVAKYRREHPGIATEDELRKMVSADKRKGQPFDPAMPGHKIYDPAE